MSYLRDAFGEQMPRSLACFRAVTERQFALVDTMISHRLQVTDTSSCGRLFDAVAALVGVRSEVTFEGQAAIALETIAAKGVEECYPFNIEEAETAILDLRPMIVEIARSLSQGRAAGEISSLFHNTLSGAIVDICSRIRESDGLNRVCLSGGTFQNVYLLRRAVAGLRSRGFRVFLHAMVPANDGGISLGQAVIANELLHRGD